MLSRVLPRSTARRIEPMQYEAVSPLGIRRGSGTAGSCEDVGPLLERLRSLEAEAGAVRQNAYEAGRRQGEQDAHTQIAPVIERFNASLAELAAMRAEARRKAERDIIDLALMVARRVLHRELAVDKGALNALVRVVLERMARTESWRLTIHPDFAAAVQAGLAATHTARVEIIADPSCVPGTAIFRSEDGVIDASVEAQLEEIARGLTDRIATKL